MIRCDVMKCFINHRYDRTIYSFTFDDETKDMAITINKYLTTEVIQLIRFYGNGLDDIFFDLDNNDVNELDIKLRNVNDESDVRRLMNEYFMKIFKQNIKIVSNPYQQRGDE